MEANTSGEDWRDLARQVQSEDNPVKMIGLIEKLLARYDEEKSARRSDVHFPETQEP